MKKRIREANYFVTKDGKVFNASGKQMPAWVVCQEFIPNPLDLPQVKHKDDNKL